MKAPPATSAHIVLATALLLFGAGCKEEATRPSQPAAIANRARAVEQAEAQRAGEPADAARGAPAAATPDRGTGHGAAPAAGSEEPAAPQYLPPSEHGAYVEITETPAGSPPPAASAPTESGSEAASAANGATRGVSAGAGGGTGGQMPAIVPSPPPLDGAPPTTRERAGAGANVEGAPTVRAPSALATPAAPDPAAAADAELTRKLQEFDALMRRAQAEAERERAADDGTRDGRGGAEEDVGGTSGAAARATGSGRAPDLSGEAAAEPDRRRAPAAVRPRIREDDDIVARQLREAAERETDPLLQRKLWDEYRKYKGS